MQEPTFPVPSCFSSSSSPSPSPHQLVVTTTYIVHQRPISITWSRSPLSHTLSLSLLDDIHPSSSFTLHLRPFPFWRRRRGSTPLFPFLLHWDLRSARFSSHHPDPISNFYLALSLDRRPVLLIGDLRDDALRRIGCSSPPPPPPFPPPLLLSREDHTFGKRQFATKARFCDVGIAHDVAVEVGGRTSEMKVKVDGAPVIDVSRLEWKFRGNQSVWIGGVKVEVCWDVHDWLAGTTGVRHGLFVFKPAATGAAAAAAEEEDVMVEGQQEFCLFLHAWKLE